MRQLALSAAVLGWLACARPPARRAQQVLAPPLSRFALELPGGQRLELVARPEGPACSPQLHLWDPRAQRELAHASAVGPKGIARLSILIPAGPPRRYELLVSADSAAHSGYVSVFRDGELLARHVPAGGAELGLLVRPEQVYQCAAAPGGTRAALLLGLDRAGALLGFDERAGPTGLPKLAHRAGLSRLIVGTLEPEAAVLRVYSNDPLDADGDGLGRGLEQALGSCDDARQPHCQNSPLAAYYARTPDATRDSDRDGLPDSAELFGLSAAALDLPRYGVDLRHKDVLVELDHHDSVSSVGFSEAELAEVAGLFARGSAADLYNLDGLPGVRLHFDAGFTPVEPAHLAIMGDFGGSGESRARDYRAARKRDFTPERAGYFRYAFVTRRGRGQARRDALTVNRDLQRVPILAHELGHTLGLKHCGHDSWGAVNCKPNYLSIMNYLYQNRVEVGFSRGAPSVLEPLAVLEPHAADSGSAAALREPPLELDVWGSAVDWNRDGMISRGPVRAGLSWATYKSCAAAEHGRVSLAQPAERAATPVLARVADRLYALWLDARGELQLRSTGLGPWDGSAACEPPASKSCTPWAAARAATGISGWQQLAASALDPNTLAVAGVDGEALPQLYRLDPLTGRSAVLARLPSVRSVHAPALARAQLDARFYGVGVATEPVLLSIVREAKTGQLWQWIVLPDGSRATCRLALDSEAQPITSGLGPSVLVLPSGELCGVFPDMEGFIRVFCYEPERDRWRDLTGRAFDAGLGPRTTSRVGMAFHHYRAADGSLLDADDRRGALILSFTEQDAGVSRRTDDPHFFVSEWLSARHGARQQLHLRWRGRVLTEWAHLAAGSGLALYADAELSSLKGLLFLRSASGPQLVHLPFADGVYDAQLGTGNDFQVMERGICTGLHTPAVCGDASTGRY